MSPMWSANGTEPDLCGRSGAVYIARVARRLFPGPGGGERANASPFSQLITFQHTADLAGRTSQYAMIGGSSRRWMASRRPRLGSATGPALTRPFPAGLYAGRRRAFKGFVDNYVAMRYGLVTNYGRGVAPIGRIGPTPSGRGLDYAGDAERWTPSRARRKTCMKIPPHHRQHHPAGRHPLGWRCAAERRLADQLRPDPTL